MTRYLLSVHTPADDRPSSMSEVEMSAAIGIPIEMRLFDSREG